MRAGAADCGRTAPRRSPRGANEDGSGCALRQGPSGREFSGGLASRRQAPSPDHSGLLSVCRFVLDVHGESEAIWPMNDALCTALQIINHLQDCGRDYRALDRVYLPLDALTEAGAAVEDLGRPQSSAALRRCLIGLAHKTD